MPEMIEQETLLVVIEICLWIIGASVVLVMMYRKAPYKKWEDKKPELVFFPKYIAHFSSPVEDIISNVENIGFELKSGSPDTYTRGMALGDFSAKAIKLHITIDQEKNLVKIRAPYWVILFDTGDLWRITSSILNGRQP